MKVAIFGLAPSRAAAIVPAGWQRWGLAWDREALTFDRVFEMHADWEAHPQPGYREWLQEFPVLYMQDTYLPNATRYPLEKVAQTCGAYWESSVAYAMALAIHEGAQEVSLVGIEMKSGEEHGYQKPNMEYLLGLARGKGIKVHIGEGSSLLRHSGEFGYVERYGWRG